jgi:geranylgeranyl reductase family protein
MKKFDVGIVGGGPIGSFVAKQIASKGFNTAIFEEHKKIGEPINCAGLVSPRIFDIINEKKEGIIQNKIYGANIHSPSGNIISIGGNKIHALVIDRAKLDNIVADSSIKNGAFLSLESKIISGKRKQDRINIRVKQDQKFENIQCKLVIGADGARSPVRKIFNFPQPIELLYSIGAEIINTQLDPNYVEIYLGRSIAPGFFAWIIPTNESGTEARIGLCVDNNYKKSLKKCFSNLLKTKELESVGILKKLGGTIPLGPLKETVESNIMLVGDAAAQVKPTSGGGIYPGLVCANHCASVAIQALINNDTSKRSLLKYHSLWTREIGRELSLGMRFRNFFKNLDDKKIDSIIDLLNNNKAIEVIKDHGDIDFPSKLILPLLKSTPLLLKFLPSVFKSKKSNFYFDGGGGM